MRERWALAVRRERSREGEDGERSKGKEEGTVYIRDEVI